MEYISNKLILVKSKEVIEFLLYIDKMAEEKTHVEPIIMENYKILLLLGEVSSKDNLRSFSMAGLYIFHEIFEDL